MKNNLDGSIKQFRSQLYKVADMVSDLYSDIDNQIVYHDPNCESVRKLFTEPIPQGPDSIERLLDQVKSDIFTNSTKHYSPHFYPWVTSCASQASILGDFLATALNVNSTTWMNSAASSEIERQVIQWIGQFSGYSETASGVLLSGGSAANLTGLTIARRLKSESNISERGLIYQQQLVIYTSDQAHFCIEKSIDLLGIGKSHLRKITTDPDFTINLKELESQILEDIDSGLLPMCIVGNAGTVNTGAIDPLHKLAKICKKFDMWFHVDAAYGGCAGNLESTKANFKGLAKADSVAIDLHKWLFVPFEAGCILVKDKNLLKGSFGVIPEYQKFNYDGDLHIDFSEYSFQQSRNFKALKVWMNFKSYGQQSLKRAIEGSIHVMNHLATIVKDSNDFELMSNNLSIVCFRYVGNHQISNTKKVNEINLKIIELSESDQRVFIRETKLNGKIVLRCCCTNFRRKKRHVEYLLKVLREIAQKIEVDGTGVF